MDAFHGLIITEHEVTFRLAKESQRVVPGRGHHVSVMLDTVIVNLREHRTDVTGIGIICNKDGSKDKRRGNTTTVIDLADADVWLSRAREAVNRLREPVDMPIANPKRIDAAYRRSFNDPDSVREQ